VERAIIIGTRHYQESPLGEPHYFDTYEWQGSKYATAEVSKMVAFGGALRNLSDLPWPVAIVGELFFGDFYEIVRKDVGLHLWWRLVSLWRKVHHAVFYARFKWRVVKTFELWGMGYQPEGETTRYRNIFRKRPR